MNLLDLLIIVAAIGYGIGGFRSGAVVGGFSLVGFFGGAALGAQLAKPLGSTLADGRAQIPIAIVCVLVLAMLGQLIGVYLAGIVRAKLVRERFRPVDAAVGALLGVVSVLLVAWMVALPLATSAYPKLAAEASQSKIVRGVNQAVPDTVRGLYGNLRTFFDRSGFPPVLGDLPSTSIVEVPPPPSNLPAAVQQRVRDSQRSIVKIYGKAPQCDRTVEGSGFVYADHKVLTNAHVVAGTDSVEVLRKDGQRVQARVTVFDANRDVAVLDVPDLNAPPLQFASRAAQRGTPAVVIGYPKDGPYTVRSARVRSQTMIRGSNIYGRDEVQRDIYAVRAIVRSGNSGGPMLGYDGKVLGMVFATALDSPDTGFVLTNDEIAVRAAEGQRTNDDAPTGGCTPE